MKIPRPKLLVPAALLAAGVVGAWLVLQFQAEPESRPEESEARAPLVRTKELEPTDWQFVVESRGTVHPRTQSTLVSEIAGTIEWVSDAFDPGEFFEKGDPLVRIEQRQYELQIVRLESEVQRARVDLIRAKEQSEVARREWEELESETQASPGPLALYGPQVEQAQAALDSAQAALDQAKLDLDRTTVHAPYDGRVRQTQADLGQFVNRGSPLATIFSVDFAEVSLPIPDDQAVFIDLPLSYTDGERDDRGPKVTIVATFQGREYRFPARIVRTEGELDPETHVIHAVARVEDPYKRRGDRPPLAVGMFVKALIEGETAEDVYVVPRTSFVERNRVMTVDASDRLQLVDVEVLRTRSDAAIVSEGLEPGVHVVVSPLETPVDGMRVRVENDSPAANGSKATGE